MKRIYTGPLTNQLRFRWIEDCRNRLRNGNTAFRMIMPTRLLIREVRSQLMGEYGEQAISNQIITFDDIVEHVLQQKESGRLRIDQEGREQAVRRAWEACTERVQAVFAALTDKPGWEEMLLLAIDEWKRSGITQEDWGQVLKAASQRIPDDIEIAEAMGAIFQSYQEVLRTGGKKGLLDAPEGYALAAAHLVQDGAALLADLEAVYIDYLTITPLQLPIVAAIARHVPHVEIYAPYAKGAALQTPNLERSMQRLLSELQSCGVEHVQIDPDDERLRELRALSESIFQEDVTPFDPGDRFLFIPSASAKQEVRAVVKEARQLINRGVAVTDICLVLPDQSDYRESVNLTCREQGVPVQLPDIKLLTEIPLLRALDACLRLQSDHWHRDTLTTIAQNRYLRLDVPAPLRLSALLRRLGYVQGYDQLLQLLAAEDRRIVAEAEKMGRSYQEDSKWQEVQSCREWIEALHGKLNVFSERGTWTQWNNAWEALVTSVGLPMQLYRWVADADGYDVHDLRRDLSGLAQVRDALDSCLRAEALFGRKSTFSYGRFYHEWESTLHQARVTISEGDSCGIAVLRPTEMRGLSYRYVFVMGLNQGVVPTSVNPSWLVDRLSPLWSEYPSHTSEQRELQEMWFRFCLQAGMERVYLSYLSAEVDERHLPSPFLEAIWRCLQKGSWQTIEGIEEALSPLPIPSSWTYATSLREKEERLAIWLSGERTLHVSADAPPQGLLARSGDRNARIKRWQVVAESIRTEYERSYVPASTWDGRLTSKEIVREIADRYNHEHVWSVSRLNEYAVCPFQFFSGQVLRLDEDEEANDGISPQDRGNFLHELARRLMNPWTVQKRPHEPHEAVDVFQAIFDQLCRDWEGTVLCNHPMWPWEKDRLQRELQVWYIQETASLLETEMRPQHLEWSFGLPIDDQLCDPASTRTILEIPVGEETLKVRGRIDRVDRSASGEWVAFYDYKTSLNRYRGRDDIAEGTDFQLPIYMAAFKEWKHELGEAVSPVGAAYYRLSSTAEKKGIWSPQAEELGLASTRKNREEEWTTTLTQAWEQLDQQRSELREGVFDAMPRESCDPYCPYSRVCRYEPIKKERKGANS